VISPCHKLAKKNYNAILFISHLFQFYCSQEYAPEILSNVRFPLLSAEFLMDRVATEEIIRNNRVCR